DPHHLRVPGRSLRGSAGPLRRAAPRRRGDRRGPGAARVGSACARAPPDRETVLPGSRARRVLLRRGPSHHLGRNRPHPLEPPRGALRAAGVGGGEALVTLYPVVMAGGSGTRFWPLSRKARPKQFLALATDRPLIVETVDRLKGLATPARTYVV